MVQIAKKKVHRPLLSRILLASEASDIAAVHRSRTHHNRRLRCVSNASDASTPISANYSKLNKPQMKEPFGQQNLTIPGKSSQRELIISQL